MILAQALPDLFGPLFEGAAGLATAPLLILAAGVLLLLLADIVPAMAGLRGPIVLVSLVTAILADLRILFAEEVPGAVLLGSYAADTTTALWGLIFLIGTLLAWFYSVGYYRGENQPFKTEHDALLLTAPAGMMLMVGAGDLLTFFVGLELLSIPLYVLAAFRRARLESVEAGVKYFLLGAFAAGIFLYGTALLYSHTGTISLLELAKPQTDLSSGLPLAGIGLITASLFFKAGVFPMHLWVPDVYEGSPTPVTALMAAGTKAAVFGVLVKISFLLPGQAAWIVGLLALITMALGNLGALVQVDLKRMLAYSGVAHAGTVLLVLTGSLGPDGDVSGATGAALFYMGAYMFTAIGAFGLLALLEGDGRKYTRLENLRGLARSRPGVAAAMTLFMLSLGGIPATGGFLGKWMVFAVLVRADMIGYAVLGVLLSVVALGYYLRVIVTMYMQPALEDVAAPVTRRPLTAGLATCICAFFVVLMGVLPGWFFSQL